MRQVRGRAALSGAGPRGLLKPMADNVETPRRNLTGAVVPALAAAGLAGLAALLLVGQNRFTPETATPRDCILENADAVNGPIDLVDGNGARITQADFAGQPAVLYFGFTHCPDVCPSSMYALAEALALPGGYDVQSILVSVDPERDTPQTIQAYARTEGFPPGLVGLSGSVAQVDAAERSFHVYSARSPIEGAPADTYNVDHSSLLYVLDGQWRTRSIVQTMRRSNENDPRSPMVAVPPETIAACIAAGLERDG
jgi:protein SCO1/2